MNTTGNSSPLALCTVISTTAPLSSSSSSSLSVSCTNETFSKYAERLLSSLVFSKSTASETSSFKFSILLLSSISLEASNSFKYPVLLSISSIKWDTGTVSLSIANSSINDINPSIPAQFLAVSVGIVLTSLNPSQRLNS